ncbi:unnamed protein product [Rotaria sp. Silwood2]|nr:unnamed protein product [Rotaria sp. Silwood2]CAF4565626.1 unnamed protein product [Rotaria sp. Silwood2]
MPKHLKKDRPPRNAPNKTARADVDDDVVTDDGLSVCSNVSDATSIYDEVEAGIPTATNVILSSDNLDEKLDSALEELRNKDLKTREHGLHALQVLFSQKYLPDQVTARSENIIEQLIPCVKKGNESEGKLAAIVASLFCIQLGEPNDDLYVKFREAIMPILRDETQSSSLRTSYAQAIGIICFIASEDISSSVDLMKSLETIFAKSYINNDGTVPLVTRDLQELHTAALSSWCFLLSTMPNNHAHDLIRM